MGKGRRRTRTSERREGGKGEEEEGEFELTTKTSFLFCFILPLLSSFSVPCSRISEKGISKTSSQNFFPSRASSPSPSPSRPPSPPIQIESSSSLLLPNLHPLSNHQHVQCHRRQVSSPSSLLLSLPVIDSSLFLSPAAEQTKESASPSSVNSSFSLLPTLVSRSTSAPETQLEDRLLLRVLRGRRRVTRLCWGSWTWATRVGRA